MLRAARAVVAAEAVRRGVVAASDLNAQAWVREFAPSLRQGGAGQVARLAVEVAGAGRAGGSLAPDAAGEPDPGSPLGLVWAGVKDASVSPGLAVSALGEIARLGPKLVPEAVPTVTEALLDLGTRWGPTQMRKLRPLMIATYGAPGEFDDLQAGLASVARLSQPWVESGDLTEYQLVMTPEQAATLEAAIGPLSKPAPNQETGERGPPAGRAAPGGGADPGVPPLLGAGRRRHGRRGRRRQSAALHVTIALADLEAAHRGR